VTLEELREETLRLLGENPASPAFWTAAQVDRYVNDAYQDFARDSGSLEIRVAIRTIAATGEYEIPENVGPVSRVSYDDYELIPDLAHKMDRKQSGWMTEAGTPERWIKSREGRHKLRVWRVPSVSSPYSVTGGEYGKMVALDVDSEEVEFNAEVGKLIDLQADGLSFHASQEVGRLCRLSFSASNLEVWGKEVPPELTRDEDEPKLLPLAHMGIAFRAAALMLQVEREGRNEPLSGIYDALADEYEDYVRYLVSARLPEKSFSPRRDIYDTRVPLIRNDEIPVPESLQP